MGQSFDGVRLGLRDAWVMCWSACAPDGREGEEKMQREEAHFARVMAANSSIILPVRFAVSWRSGLHNVQRHF